MQGIKCTLQIEHSLFIIVSHQNYVLLKTVQKFNGNLIELDELKTVSVGQIFILSSYHIRIMSNPNKTIT